jgi:hypothetical protein
MTDAERLAACAPMRTLGRRMHDGKPLTSMEFDEYLDQGGIAGQIDARRALCGARVTLDGRPAKIGGARCDFAAVSVLPDGPSYEFAWPTVARIVAIGGDFRS